MNIYQDPKTKRWKIDYYDHQKRRRLKTFDSRAEADTFAIETKRSLQRGTYVPQSKKTVAEMAEDWIQREKKQGKSYRYKTLQNYQIHIDNYIKPELGEREIQRVTIKDCEEAALAWAARCSPNTANKALGTLTAIFNLAMRWGILNAEGANVAEKAERMKVATDEDEDRVILPEDVYGEEELGKLIFEGTEPGTPERILLELSGFCGLRIGEILGFTWPAIDLSAKNPDPKLQVLWNLVSDDKATATWPGYKGTGRSPRHPKSVRSRRMIDAPRELVQDLRLWKLKCPQTEHMIVMATVEKRPFQPKKCQKMMDDACKRAGVTRRTLHRLRHSFGSLLIKATGGIPKVSRLLGHETPASTAKVYTHFIPDNQKSVQDLASRIAAHQKK